MTDPSLSPPEPSPLDELTGEHATLDALWAKWEREEELTEAETEALIDREVEAFEAWQSKERGA